MQLTKEALQKQLEVIKNSTDGFLQGYAQALTWVNQTLETEKPVEQVKS
jgi:hypothetical protein